MKCKCCGIQTPRLTLTQRYCPECEQAINTSKTYGVVSGNIEKTSFPTNPFMERVRSNTLSGKVLS